MKNLQSTGNLFGQNITIKQISKAMAKKLFAQGIEIYIQSSNMYPFNMWQSVCPIKLDIEQLNADISMNEWTINLYADQVKQCNDSADQWRKDMLPHYESDLNNCKNKVINALTQFGSVINNYKYYNCDNERGKYVHFYMV